VHCMVKEETFGRMAHPTPSWTTQQLGSLESALVAFENRHIRSESLGGGCEAVQELVREIPAICGSYMVLPSLCEIPTTSLCVLDSHHPCLPYLWSSHGPQQTSPDPCSAPPVLTLRGARFRCQTRRVQVDGRIRWMQVESVDPFGTILHDAARAKVKM